MIQKLSCVALACIALSLGACVSSGGSSNEPDYVKAQIYQAPSAPDDSFGDNLLPGPVGGPM